MTFLKRAGFPLFFIISVFVFSGCIEREQFYRQISPDGLVEAILFRSNDSEGKSFRYDLYIVPNGKKPQFNKSLFSGNHAKNIKVSWQGSRMLQIRFDEVQIHHFQNYWRSKAVQNSSYVVELKLIPNKRNHTLPSYIRGVQDPEPDPDNEPPRW
jgi:hypothetical protein